MVGPLTSHRQSQGEFREVLPVAQALGHHPPSRTIPSTCPKALGQDAQGRGHSCARGKKGAASLWAGNQTDCRIWGQELCLQQPSKKPKGPSCQSDTSPPGTPVLACQGNYSRAQTPSWQPCFKDPLGPTELRCSIIMPIRAGRGALKPKRAWKIWGTGFKICLWTAATVTGVETHLWLLSPGLTCTLCTDPLGVR